MQFLPGVIELLDVRRVRVGDGVVAFEAHELRRVGALHVAANGLLAAGEGLRGLLERGECGRVLDRLRSVLALHVVVHSLIDDGFELSGGNYTSRTTLVG